MCSLFSSSQGHNHFGQPEVKGNSTACWAGPVKGAELNSIGKERLWASLPFSLLTWGAWPPSHLPSWRGRRAAWPPVSVLHSTHPRKASALSHLASSHVNLSSSRLRPPRGAQREEPSSVSLPPRAKAQKHPSSHRSITPAMCCSNICISVATKATSSPTCSLKVILCHLLPHAYTLLDFGTAWTAKTAEL